MDPCPIPNLSLVRCARITQAHIDLAAPFSFWGGVDVETGRVIDHSHPDLGQLITGRVLVMPGGRGSSSASSVFADFSD
ncbi:MAG: DUF126 domain-containing protein [Acidobacteriota bacterium]|nr:DUF126 domain-containing protein [Acidobacteriota bacterium]MDQ3417284.1 DUF126 domain-containing protein [Acidobacteriota bacterium]